MVQFGLPATPIAADRQLLVTEQNLTGLVIKEADPASGLHYFWHPTEHRLISDFILKEGPQVDTICRVTLVKTDGTYTARPHFWKRDKTKKAIEQTEMPATGSTRPVKSSVDLDDCQAQFWMLINWLQAFAEISFPATAFKVVDQQTADLAAVLADKSKSEVLSAVKAHFAGGLTEADVRLLVDRKSQLERFERLLHDPDYFESVRAVTPGQSSERVWQDFFEQNQWIFGYGLSLVSCESYDPAKLEQMTTGNNIFTGAGKRVDTLMRTRGFVSSLLFAEIKRHDTPLLSAQPYRKPDVYAPADELVGGVAQIQKTAYKAISQLGALYRQHDVDGSYQFEVSTVSPRKVLVIGRLTELAVDGHVNVERLTSLELYRRSVSDVDIVTFDELYERASLIVG